jgi:hypothetical protein
LNNNNGYDKIKVANGIQQRSYTTMISCSPLDIEVKKPRICGRHIMRDNVEAECPEDYFRKSITVPLLDYALNEMKTRFTGKLYNA